MKIQFKPKYNINVSKSIESQFTEEVENRGIKKLTVQDLIKQLASKFGRAVSGKSETSETQINSNVDRNLEAAEIDFLNSGYHKNLRGDGISESTKIAQFRENLISQSKKR
jgi:predicted AAA+ superfamily ATPase